MSDGFDFNVPGGSGMPTGGDNNPKKNDDTEGSYKRLLGDKPITWFWLMQHYSKPNAAAYKAQKEARKAAKKNNSQELQYNTQNRGNTWNQQNAQGQMNNWNPQNAQNQQNRGNAWNPQNTQVQGNAWNAQNQQVQGNVWNSQTAQGQGNVGNQQSRGNIWNAQNQQVQGNAWNQQNQQSRGNAWNQQTAQGQGNTWNQQNQQVRGSVWNPQTAQGQGNTWNQQNQQARGNIWNQQSAQGERPMGSAANHDGKTVVLNRNEGPSAAVEVSALLDCLNYDQTIEISRTPFVIGREQKDVDLCLSQNAHISAKHAVIHYANGSFYITDLESRNHVFVNDKKIAPDQPVILNDSDRITLADEEFIFHKQR